MSDQRYKDEAYHLFHCGKCDARFLMGKAGGAFDCPLDGGCGDITSSDVELYELSYVGTVASIEGGR